LIARLTTLLLALVTAAPASAQGELTIRITQGVEDAQPIAVVPFATAEGPAAPVDIAAIVASDLARSGLFRPLPFEELPARPSEPADVNYGDWRLLGTPALVIGRVSALATGGFAVEFRLMDVFRTSQLIGRRFEVPEGELRSIAHHVSDLVYEALTGLPGAFNTRIAYVTETASASGERRYSLNVADSDGFGARSILSSSEPILSPAWSPDGTRLAYVLFQSRRPRIFVQHVPTGDRRQVAGFPGLNSAPAWAPDGERLAMTLSKDGNPEIYVLELASERLRRITDNVAIDTEAAWAPDGQSLVFTSDRSGRPQLYRVPASGGSAARLTFEGNYNARATFSPDGGRLAFVHGADAAYRIAVLELEQRALRVLTDGRLDESPSFAPNGSMILYATVASGSSALATVSVDGRVRHRLAVAQGEVREPAWSPPRRAR